jgi:hypothetical protein
MKWMQLAKELLFGFDDDDDGDELEFCDNFEDRSPAFVAMQHELQIVRRHQNRADGYEAERQFRFEREAADIDRRVALYHRYRASKANLVEPERVNWQREGF